MIPNAVRLLLRDPSLFWRKAKARLLAYLGRPGWQRVYGLYGAQGGGLQQTRRALLSYIVHPFLLSPDDPRLLQHINTFHARMMVQVLNELGFVVDVIDYRDSRFVPRRDYDLFIGHGGINYERIAGRLAQRALKIFFSTGSYWRFHNEQELARFAALRERRGVVLSPDRFIRDGEEGALQAADAVIGIGGDSTARTYNGFSPVIMLNNTALADHDYGRQPKDFSQARNHFLFFSGSGNVHKGLDLLLEVFSTLQGQHLWIATRLEPDFERVYAGLLYGRPNVHPCGWIQPRSDLFYELVHRSAYAILPSCSEGQPGSVVECMNQGLIPVVSRECGLDVEGFGIILKTCEIPEITGVVEQLAVQPAHVGEEMANKARTAATTLYSEVAFHHSFRTALERLHVALER